MTVQSPCRKVCVLDASTRICTGCGRTLDEIADWSRLDDEAKRRVIAGLEARLVALAAKRGPADVR